MAIGKKEKEKMSDNLKDILSNLNKDIEQEKLLDYLNKKLSDADAHEVEKQMADDEFMNDAVEGLEHFKNKERLLLLVEQLNKDLKKQTAKKNKRKEKRKLKDQPWIYIAVITFLLLIIIAFIVIKIYMQS